MPYKITDFTSLELSQVMALRKRLGWTGYGIYCAIIYLLERQPDAAFECDYNRIGFHLSAEEDTVRSIVEDFNLFDFEQTSAGRRFFLASMRKEAERRALISERRAEAARRRWDKKGEEKEDREEKPAPRPSRSEATPQPRDMEPEPLKCDLLRNPQALSDNQEWFGKVAADFKCSVEVLGRLYRLFLKHLADSQREPYNTLRDAQKHFYYWLKKSYAADQRRYLMRVEEQERRSREREEHDSKAISYTEYQRRCKMRELQAERAS